MTGGSNSSSQMSNSRKTENMKKPDPISSAIITLSSLFFCSLGPAVETPWSTSIKQSENEDLSSSETATSKRADRESVGNETTGGGGRGRPDSESNSIGRRFLSYV